MTDENIMFPDDENERLPSNSHLNNSDDDEDDDLLDDELEASIEDVFDAFDDVHEAIDFIESFITQMICSFAERESESQKSIEALQDELEEYKRELTKAYQELAVLSANKEK